MARNNVTKGRFRGLKLQSRQIERLILTIVCLLSGSPGERMHIVTCVGNTIVSPHSLLLSRAPRALGAWRLAAPRSPPQK